MNSKFLATIAWASVISIAWLFVLGVIVFDFINVGFFVFFFIVAIISSAVSSKLGE